MVAHTLRKKPHSWDYLAKHAPKPGVPWLIVGDLNIILCYKVNKVVHPLISRKLSLPQLELNKKASLTLVIKVITLPGQMVD